MIELLQELKTIAEGANLGKPLSVKICFNIMAAIYDYNPNIATCMKSEMWEKWVLHLHSLARWIFDFIFFVFCFFCTDVILVPVAGLREVLLGEQHLELPLQFLSTWPQK